MNLFEIMRAAGGGDAFARLGPQYGLSEQQMTAAVQAFLPAFSAGLKRSTADPFGLLEFMRRLATPEYMRAYLNPESARTAARAPGEDALTFLFGSPEAARAVAGQASAFTGLAQETMNALMPALAAMTFGGLAKQATAANPILEAWLRQVRAEPTPQAAGAQGPLDRYEEEQARREQQGGGAADLAGAQADMIRAGLAAFQAGGAAWQQAAAEMMKSHRPAQLEARGAEAASSGQAVFGDMFEPGLRISEAYLREMEALIGRLRSEAKRSAGKP